MKDLDHLALLVKEDPAISAKAQTLATRHTSALTVGGIIFATGLLVAVTGMGKETCETQAAPFPGAGTTQLCRPDGGQVVLGAGISLVGGITMVLLFPRQGDLLDVINSWNVAHPDRPFELSPGGHHPVLDQVAGAAPP